MFLACNPQLAKSIDLSSLICAVGYVLSKASYFKDPQKPMSMNYLSIVALFCGINNTSDLFPSVILTHFVWMMFSHSLLFASVILIIQ